MYHVDLSVWHLLVDKRTSKKGICLLLYAGPVDKSFSSVPMARRKHLFSSRTQKLSSSAAIILRKWESSTVPNCKKTFRIGRSFYFMFDDVIFELD